jgi:hypothetical protein
VIRIQRIEGKKEAVPLTKFLQRKETKLEVLKYCFWGGEGKVVSYSRIFTFRGALEANTLKGEG